MDKPRFKSSSAHIACGWSLVADTGELWQNHVDLWKIWDSVDFCWCVQS